MKATETIPQNSVALTRHFFVNTAWVGLDRQGSLSQRCRRICAVDSSVRTIWNTDILAKQEIDDTRRNIAYSWTG